MGSDDSFENRLKAIADQLAARSLSDADVDDVAQRFGVDPERVRGVTGAVERWLNDRGSEGEPLFGERAAGRAQDPRTEPTAEPAVPDFTRVTPTPTPSSASGAGPHPLDPPTEAQGIALSALESGRWTVRPGSSRLIAAEPSGPWSGPPAEASDLVNELRARDWITADGAVTLVGRQALLRWTRTVDADAD